MLQKQWSSFGEFGCHYDPEELSINSLLLFAPFSNHCPAGMQSTIVPPSHKPNRPHDASDEPQEQADKVYPDGILHPLHP